MTSFVEAARGRDEGEHLKAKGTMYTTEGLEFRVLGI